MSKIILDADLKSKLNGLDEQLELCTEEGTRLGWFVPESVYMRLLYAEAKQRHTDEEVEELSRQTGGCTLQEIWQRLGQS